MRAHLFPYYHGRISMTQTPIAQGPQEVCECAGTQQIQPFSTSG
jgi:hypothetical protein